MTLHHGDCLDVMAGMEPESVDAVVTDPPYDLTNRVPDVFRCEACLRVLGGRDGAPDVCPRCSGRLVRQRKAGGFMGKAWDGTGIAFDPETWAACLRVAKPSAYLLAFGGTRTVHRMTVAIEDAGWIIRDMLVWAYASGFPKSKASLKPAWEPIVMARKPGPLRELAIDACRIPTDDDPNPNGPNGGRTGASWRRMEGREDVFTAPTYAMPAAGRWPANVILTDPIFDGGWDGVVGGGEAASGGNINGRPVTGYSKGWADERWFEGYQDSGTYSRFFLIPKADRADREPSIVEVAATATRGGRDGLVYTRARQNTHPTVKSTDLMRHLVRLVTPTGGIVLDPLAGSGSTLLAAEMEGFEWIGIEKEAEYVAIAEARLNGTQRGLGLPA